MREIERFVILQVVDTRWREHLESMDYLREGVHLRAMAQKDPLVEYRGEGHVCSRRSARSIREEVVLTLFHVEIERTTAPQTLHPPSPAGALLRARDSAGADLDRAAGRRPRRRPPLPHAAVPGQVVKDRERTSGATIPAGAARARSSSAVTGREGSQTEEHIAASDTHPLAATLRRI